MQAAVRADLKNLATLSDLSVYYPTEKDIVHLLMNESLLKKEFKCEKCGKDMTLRSRGNTYEWRCRVSKGKDCSSKSVKTGSFFANTKLTLTQAVKIMTMWNMEFSAKKISAESGASENTVCDWRNFLREACGRVASSYSMIGGPNHVVEIDETNVHSRKYGIGKGSDNEDWILGGLDRTTGKVFACRVPNRTASTLVPLLQSNVDKQSIYSDEWRSYSRLKNYFAAHYTVKHKTQFVNIIQNRRICTNGIESFWSRLKKPFKAGNGTSTALLDSYVTEYVVRENEKGDFFGRIIDAMKL